MVTSRGASGEEDLCHSSKFSKDFEATAWADGSAEDTTPHASRRGACTCRFNHGPSVARSAVPGRCKVYSVNKHARTTLFLPPPALPPLISRLKITCVIFFASARSLVTLRHPASSSFQVTTLDISHIISSERKYHGGVLGPNGLIYFVPYGATLPYSTVPNWHTCPFKLPLWTSPTSLVLGFQVLS